MNLCLNLTIRTSRKNGFVPLREEEEFLLQPIFAHSDVILNAIRFSRSSNTTNAFAVPVFTGCTGEH